MSDSAPSPAIPVANHVVSITARKGGTGKTSLTVNIAGLAAERGYRVAVLDADPQGNATSELLHGDKGDRGEALAEALMFERALRVQKEVRPNLDLICGGDRTEMLAYAVPADDPNDAMLRLRRALHPIVSNYDLILIDHPPLVRPLREMGLAASRFAVIPTRPDDASVAGVGGVARDFARVRQVNPTLELLGVVLFGVGSSSKTLREDVRKKVSAGLGTMAPVFDPVIRYMESPATNARNSGLPVHEYARQLSSSSRFVDRKAGASAGKLAGDYLALTATLLSLMETRLAEERERGKHEAAPAAVGER